MVERQCLCVVGWSLVRILLAWESGATNDVGRRRLLQRGGGATLKMGHNANTGREEEGKRERRRLHFDWRVLRYFSSCWCKGVLTRGKKNVCVLRVLERRQREESLTECVCAIAAEKKRRVYR